MKNISLIVAASLLVVFGWAHPGAAFSAPSSVLNPTGSIEIIPPALLVPEPTKMACQVVYPVAGDDYVTTRKDTSVDFRPLDNDTDTPDQDFWGYTEPAHGTLQLIGIDGLRYTPDAGYVGSDSFTYTLGGCLQCSNFGGGSWWCSEPESDEGTVYITITQ